MHKYRLREHILTKYVVNKKLCCLSKKKWLIKYIKYVYAMERNEMIPKLSLSYRAHSP